MSSFNDILNNLKGGIEIQGERAYGTITEAWDSFKNLDSISLPNFDVKNLFGSIAQMTSKFSDAGSGDTKQTDILSGLTSIWTKDSPELQGIAKNENKKQYTVKSDETGEMFKISEEEYDATRDNAEYVVASASNTFEGTPVTKFQGMDSKSHDDYYGSVVDTSDADRLNFQTPDWSYADFINERAIFQKSLQNPVGEQGWFYFKIFFNFDTQYGLFGGLLNDPDPMMATNSAYKYLRACEALGQYYKTNDRQVALMKFAKILSYIST